MRPFTYIHHIELYALYFIPYKIYLSLEMSCREMWVTTMYVLKVRSYTFSFVSPWSGIVPALLIWIEQWIALLFENNLCCTLHLYVYFNLCTWKPWGRWHKSYTYCLLYRKYYSGGFQVCFCWLCSYFFVFVSSNLILATTTLGQKENLPWESLWLSSLMKTQICKCI